MRLGGRRVIDRLNGRSWMRGHGDAGLNPLPSRCSSGGGATTGVAPPADVCDSTAVRVRNARRPRADGQQWYVIAVT